MNCTWKDCKEPAVHSHLDREDREWSKLCDAHHKELEEAMDSLKAKRLVRAWALAGSSHPSRKELASNISKGCEAIARLAKGFKVREKDE